MRNNEAAALAALREAGLLLDSIEFDGKRHRCPVADKPKEKDGAYVAYADAPVTVWWQNHRSGESGTWTAKGQGKLSKAERETMAKRMEENRTARATEEARAQAAAAKKAKEIYDSAADCAGHPYLELKGVKSVPGLKVSTDNKLIIPARNGQGKIVTLQFIDEAGEKRFLANGKKTGAFFAVGGKAAEKPLLIAEGLATALSLFECIGFPVLTAFDAGNLQSVAELARRLYPKREIIICADNDIKEDGSANVGVEKAAAAALAMGGRLAVPRRDGQKYDWNDLHLKMGAGEVRVQFQDGGNLDAQGRTEQEPKAQQQNDNLQSGFCLRESGIWHIEAKDGKEPVETWLGPPLQILGATRDEQGNAWGLLLSWLDPDGRKRSWAMPKALLTNKDASVWLGKLMDEGWSGSPGNRARNLLAVYLATYKTVDRVLCVNCTGWHHGAFVLPDAVIKCRTQDKSAKASASQNSKTGQCALGNSRAQNESVQNEPAQDEPSQAHETIALQAQSPHNPFQTGGTLSGWQNSIGLWASGNSRLILAICAALAAPLLDVAGQESGGFNWTGQSSTGKTTALVAAGSVWGKGASSGGYIQNWRATANGLEGLAALHSDAALCLDEIGQAPGRAVMEAAYMLANGMGKARAFTDGSARAVRTWRCMVLSTGEKGLAEKIEEEGGRVQAGQAVRLIDVPADAGAGFGLFENLHGHENAMSFADAIKAAAITHYGHTARAFIAAFQDKREQAEQTLRQSLASGLGKLCVPNADGQVLRVAKRFLLCAVSGEMAAEWGILPWEQGAALEAVKKCFKAWLGLRGGTGPAEDAAILSQVTLFIEQHGASRFQDINNPDALCINRVGFRRNNNSGDSTIYYILSESFKEICKGHNTLKAARALRDAGFLLTEDKHLKIKLPQMTELGRPRCYALTFKDDENESA